MRKLSFFAVAVVSCTFCSGVRAQSIEPDVSSVDDVSESAPIDTAAARADFELRHPQAQVMVEFGRITRVYGLPMSGGDSAVQAAEAFRQREAALFGVAPDQLRPFGPGELPGHVVPLMYRPATGDYKFTLVCYGQYLESWPVYQCDLRLLVRNQPGSPLVLAASSLRDLAGFRPDAALAKDLGNPAYVAARFEAARAQALAHTPELLNFTPPAVVVWAGVDDMPVTPAMALLFEGDNGAPGVVTTKRIRFITDVVSGKVLHTESRILHADIVGIVQGLASQGPAADQCAVEVVTPMPYARINAGATTVYADVNGNYILLDVGPDPVVVESPMSGLWFDVTSFQSSTETLSQNVTAPIVVDFLHNAANTGPVLAQVNAYISANQVRDRAIFANPSYPTLSNGGFPIVVNRTDGFCPGNAWYDPALTSINFCLPGGQYPNTAWTSVVYHEYGHHLVAAGGSGQGQYGEGMGDVMSLLLLDDHRLGLGFFGPCDQTLRTAEAGLDYPCSGAIHTCGQLLSGCVWYTRNALAVTEPDDYLDILASLAINSILLHTGTSITPQITLDWLVLDDNDELLANGTPHCSEICEGFGEHNMTCPPLGNIVISYPEGLPATVNPGQPTAIRVQVSGDVAIEEVRAFYRSDATGGQFVDVVLVETPPGEYTFNLPAQTCLDIVDYYFVARGGCAFANGPAAGAAAPHRAPVASSLSTVVQYDFETNPGWTVSGTVTDGPWDRGVPVNCNRGDPPIDADGSGQCWLTDNSAANGCNSDVDGGTTILTTNAINLSGVVQPYVRYYRWFSNASGAGPQTDRFMVDVSSNNGLSWTALEIVGPTAQSEIPDIFGGWIQVIHPVPSASQFRMRFIAEDVGAASVVEAAVDGFEIIDWQCQAPCAGATGDLNGDGDVDGEDVPGFVGAVLNGASAAQVCAGDFSLDGQLDQNDVTGLVAALLAP